MAIRSLGFALALMLLLAVVGAQDTTLVSFACNGEIIPSRSPFFDTLGNLIVDLEQSTALNGYDYKTSSAGSPTAYGEAICNEASPSDCTACLISIGDRIGGICNNAIGAQVQLTDCFMRYEQFPFY